MKQDNAMVSNLISQLIQGEWDSVDMYNSILITLQEVDNPEIKDIINDIVSEHYVHIGQLEKALQLVNPVAELIDDENAIEG